ncbi:MAG: glycosyltransferase [Roseitalea sp.]|nr:glycosyltransferase [Roseitalea sp.]MBO6950905.1 glycosyltransferase [Rhizobiaceae bacterium]MBO6591108.1 glycosyltransferase [Roseitalea sp.]MBO6613885.1 glycosyltransferase [Roseitalea sp.]MBO6664907.1 glycosyltransferase [Roseitalea sp.]
MQIQTGSAANGVLAKTSQTEIAGKCVLHVVTTLRSGGAERMLTRIVTWNETSKVGAGGDRLRHVVVTLTDGGVHAETLCAAGVPVHTLSMRTSAPAAAAGLFRLIALMRRYKPRMVMSWLYHADLLATLAAPFAGNPPLVWNIRCSSLDLDNHPRSTRYIVRALARLSRRPCAVAANSTRGRKVHQALGYRPRRWTLLPNGFEPDVWRPDEDDRQRMRAALGYGDDDIVAVLVARLDPEKDHQTFLAAALRAARACDNLRFLLIGKGTETLPVEPALQDKLMAMGERSDVEVILRACDLSVLSSRSEGFPNVVGEAMATGLPCVVTDVGDAAAIVGDTGLICPSHDPEAMADALLLMVAGGPEHLRRRGKMARDRIVNRYSLEAAVAAYRSLWLETP